MFGNVRFNGPEFWLDFKGEPWFIPLFYLWLWTNQTVHGLTGIGPCDMAAGVDLRVAEAFRIDIVGGPVCGVVICRQAGGHERWVAWLREWGQGSVLKMVPVEDWLRLVVAGKWWA